MFEIKKFERTVVMRDTLPRRLSMIRVIIAIVKLIMNAQSEWKCRAQAPLCDRKVTSNASQ